MTCARSITLALGGQWYGRYGSARCPAHRDRRPSLSLANGTDGRLLARCHAGCEFNTVINSLRALGLVEGRRPFAPPNPHELASLRTAGGAETRRREVQARSCWAEAQPIEGTLAELYLRGRGITSDLPRTLRYHPACWHASVQRLPAVVALVQGGNGFAIHRTYLRPDGSGKAEVEPAKAMLGSVAGGAVRLVSPPRNADLPLVVAEGIETALSLASGLLAAPSAIWAALSTSGLKRLHLPAWPGRLTIAPDGDKAGREAAQALAARAHALGWQVSLLPAPEGQDWNDVLTIKNAKGDAA